MRTAPVSPDYGFVDLLAGLSVQTPQAAERLAEALLAMEMVPVTQFRTVAGPAECAERMAVELQRPDLRMRARLVRADVLRREGDVVESGRIAQQVNAWAAEHGHRYLLARSHRGLAQFFRQIGDLADALAHGVQSIAYTDDDLPARIQAAHLSTLAMVLHDSGSSEEARRRYQETLDLARAAGDDEMSLQTLNNMAYAEYENGNGQMAQELVGEIRAMAVRLDLILGAHILDTIARIEIAQGRYAEAEATLRPILDGSAGYLVSEGNGLAECLLTVAEAQRRRGDIEAAQATVARAARVCEERGLASVRARVRDEQAQLYAVAGRYREAFEEYLLFHAETQALQSAQREARARTLQAVFETEEARRESLRFRELAQRDALTGLHNRRYVDEQLALLLKHAAERRARVSVALVDLDHFKRINDTLSHAAGDLVLQQVAALLTAAAAEDGVAARLGGEEFLLVLPDTDAGQAVRRCNQLRQAIRAHRWQPVTGDIPVTASIGVTTTTGDPTTVSALLARADENLYAAKRAGRDRVIADPA